MPPIERSIAAIANVKSVVAQIRFAQVTRRPDVVSSRLSSKFRIVLFSAMLASSTTMLHSAEIPPVAAPSTFSLYPSDTVPAQRADPDVRTIEVGVKFRADVGGVITGIRFYKSETNIGVHTGSLWSNNGVLLGRVTFVDETASGWQQALFAKPVAITAATTYVASYHAPVGQYSADEDAGGFLTGGRHVPPLHGLQDKVDGPNGVYAYGPASVFPTETFRSSNYYVDVIFRTRIAGDTAIPPIALPVPPPAPPAEAPPSALPPSAPPPVEPPTSGTPPRSTAGTSDFTAGVVTHLGPGGGTTDPIFDHLVALGVKSYRQDIQWSWIETQRGVLSFNSPGNVGFDNFVTRTHEAGMDPLFILCYGNALYDGGGFPLSEEAQAGFVRYAVFVANHFKGRVKKYEVWNEWNAGVGTPNGTIGDAASYNALLRKVYAALKAVDPEIVVIGGVATANMSWSVSLFAIGGLSAMDAYSAHPYLYPQIPEDSLAWFDLLEQNAQEAAGGRAIPLYATEIGWPTIPGDRGGVSQATAGDYLARLYLLGATYSYIKGIWWYDLYDDGPDPLNQRHNFGLYGQVFRPLLTGWAGKPAACAMIEVTKLQAGYAPLYSRRDDDGVWLVKYTNGTDYVYGLWTDKPGASVNATVTALSPSGAPITARGICRTVSVTGNGSTSLATVISNAPTLFTTAGAGLVLTKH
ncbi:MAG: DUF4082 domain-containing protein [Betaproteobacteria bacterium]